MHRRISERVVNNRMNLSSSYWLDHRRVGTKAYGTF
jgi:hypothetical protein